MCAGRFPDYTDGNDMEKCLKPWLDQRSDAIADTLFPSSGTTCNITFKTKKLMWEAINGYKEGANI
eukprot:2860293-Pyramimonas_sp.AAC.1